MKESIHIKYLFTTERDIQWGLTVNTVGTQHIEAGGPYPPPNHPTRYLFSPQNGRILEEYQLLYITHGRGTFVSQHCPEREVQAGNMFLLFPHEWHNYHPDPATGWNEYWIGFSGESVDRRTGHEFFDKKRPIYEVGIRNELVGLYKQAIATATEQLPGFQQVLAGIVNHLLGCAYSYDKQASLEDVRAVQLIDRAKVIILENLQSITPAEVAQRLNLGYSWFRRIFKQYTGIAPIQYIIEMRIQRCKELLTNTSMSSLEIAYETGFDNPDYFCTLFKKRVGTSPTRYREFTQGKIAIIPYNK